MTWNCLLGDWFNVDCTASLGLFLLFIMFIVVVYLFCSCKQGYLYPEPIPKDTMALMPVMIPWKQQQREPKEHTHYMKQEHRDHPGEHTHYMKQEHRDHPGEHTHYMKQEHTDHGETVYIDVNSLTDGKLTDHNQFYTSSFSKGVWDVTGPSMKNHWKVRIHILGEQLGSYAKPNVIDGEMVIPGLIPGQIVATCVDRGGGNFRVDSAFEVGRGEIDTRSLPLSMCHQ